MATLDGSLWQFNLAKVIIVDVTDDYKLMQPPLPSDFYPVLREVWLPRHKLAETIHASDMMAGYLYDWHESPDTEHSPWYVGVVSADMAFAEPPPRHMPAA
ncbi:MAG: hypothetical protein HY248_01520 [Fimbriimonas ginsengisoli]|uniref:Uncharacterized protein n=1 Tax=Fimbriimonas ginsengisoli TaxID=1005039 RepID=A0A931LVS0_FIMGI|nr:hypothetical protein [Fimbriimonas ginsengisoli]MBI3721205.1 hypothetical protein [Fimbriimonas ginsengisoli]